MHSPVTFAAALAISPTVYFQSDEWVKQRCDGQVQSDRHVFTPIQDEHVLGVYYHGQENGIGLTTTAQPQCLTACYNKTQHFSYASKLLCGGQNDELKRFFFFRTHRTWCNQMCLDRANIWWNCDASR